MNFELIDADGVFARARGKRKLLRVIHHLVVGGINAGAYRFRFGEREIDNWKLVVFSAPRPFWRLIYDGGDYEGRERSVIWFPRDDDDFGSSRAKIIAEIDADGALHFCRPRPRKGGPA